MRKWRKISSVENLVFLHFNYYHFYAKSRSNSHSHDIKSKKQDFVHFSTRLVSNGFTFNAIYLHFSELHMWQSLKKRTIGRKKKCLQEVRKLRKFYPTVPFVRLGHYVALWKTNDDYFKRLTKNSHLWASSGTALVELWQIFFILVTAFCKCGVPIFKFTLIFAFLFHNFHDQLWIGVGRVGSAKTHTNSTITACHW